MKTEALLKLNIHITGKEVVLLEKLANSFIKVADYHHDKVDGELYEFAKEVKIQIANCLVNIDIDMEVQDA
jgi:hypothetical protein